MRMLFEKHAHFLQKFRQIACVHGRTKDLKYITVWRKISRCREELINFNSITIYTFKPRVSLLQKVNDPLTNFIHHWLATKAFILKKCRDKRKLCEYHTRLFCSFAGRKLLQISLCFPITAIIIAKFIKQTEIGLISGFEISCPSVPR